VSFSGGSGQIPVEALLKLSLDKAGADTIQKFLDGHEQQWGRIEGSISRISSGVQEITRFGMGALGVAGIGALAQNFIGSSTAGSNVALAAGQMTGGMSAWHPYSQAMLGAQAKTGVPSTQIAQGLILALQSVGGSPSPNQAALLGGLLAGFGQVEGLTPAQVSQIVGPMLQAANKPLTAANLSSMLASTQAVMTATPGSQSAAQLGVVSQIALQQAIGAGPGGAAPQPVQTAAILNAAIQTNSIWRPSAGVEQSATSSIQSGLQGAYQNPSQEAFMTMAGISYADQRYGFSGPNVTKIMAAATKQYGTGPTRDIMLRSMFGGVAGANFLETFSPGSPASKILAAHPNATPAEINALQNAVKHPQAGTTPQSWLDKAAGKIFGFAESGLPQGLAVGAGALFGADALLKTPGLAYKGLGAAAKGLFGAGGEEAAAAGSALEGDVGGGLLESLLGIGVGGASMGLGATLGALAFPDSVGYAHGSSSTAVNSILAQARRKFGRSDGSKASEQWMWNQLGFRFSQYQDGIGVGGHEKGTPARTYAWDLATAHGENPGGATQAQQMLQKLFQSFNSSQDPITTFQQAVNTLQQAANQLKAGSGPHATGTSYQLGSSGGAGVLGTPAIQALGMYAPGMEYASLTQAAGSAGGTAFASLNLSGGSAGASGGSAGGTSPSTSGGGWQTAVASWYDPGAGGMNGSYGSGAWAGHPVEPTTNGFAHRTMAFGTQVEFQYQGKSVTATCVDRGPFIAGRTFDLLPIPARAIGMTGAGVVTLKWRTAGMSAAGSSGSSSGSAGGGGGSGSSGGASAGSGSVVSAVASMAMMSAGAAAGGGSGAASGPIHVHVHIDGKEIRKARVLKGHKP
jgi:hypothetical protein